MSFVTSSDSPLVEIRRLMRHWVELGNRKQLVECLLLYREHVVRLVDIPHDAVSEHADRLGSEILDIAVSLVDGGIRCNDAFVIFDARVDSFVYESLEPWIHDNYIDVSVIPHCKKVMGKA